MLTKKLIYWFYLMEKKIKSNNRFNTLLQRPLKQIEDLPKYKQNAFINHNYFTEILKDMLFDNEVYEYNDINVIINVIYYYQTSISFIHHLDSFTDIWHLYSQSNCTQEILTQQEAQNYYNELLNILPFDFLKHNNETQKGEW